MVDDHRGRREMRLDWDKPIQFENGEPCHLLETRPGGFEQFRDRTRLIQRDGVEGITALWFMPEDGKSTWPGFNVVNVPERMAALEIDNDRLRAALETAANRLADEGYGRWAREARAAFV